MARSVALLPEKFDGSQNYNDWVSHFDCVSKINDWSDREKALWLRACVSGRAHVAYNLLSHEIQESFDLCKTALQERFEPSSKREYYKLEFERRQKRTTEGWADFGDDLRSLADKAYPELQDKARGEISLIRYLNQLESQQMSLAVRQCKPQTIGEAVTATLEFESCLMASDKNQSSHQSGESSTANQPLHQLQCLVNMLHQLQQRLTNLEASGFQYPATPPISSKQRRHRLTQERNVSGGCVICRRCKQQGHYARGCASNRVNKSIIPTDNNQGSEEQEACTIAINSVTSCYLKGQMFNKSVSFLVDTGAGVSLLNGEMWDKIKPKNIKIEATKFHNLVGVDGHPIKVRGSARLPVTIAEVEFQQMFIIADGITTEGILGMDFMEENKCLVDIGDKKISFKDGKWFSLAPSVSTTSDNSVHHVTLGMSITIPAASELEVMAHLPALDGQWLIEGVQNNKVLIARAVVTPTDKSIPLRIANTSAMPVTLYNGMKVAIAEPVAETNINTLSELTHQTSRSIVRDQEDIALQVPLPENLTVAEREKFLVLLSHYANVFAANNDDLGRTTVLNHEIITNGAQPIRQQARRVPLPHRDKVQELLQDMLQKGVISPSKSPWASPIVLVKKKDGSTRFCVDYRKVNLITRKDAYPIPRVDDTLDTLAGSVWFTTLDLKSGYWQVEVAEEHREKTAFCTQEGLFEFNVMPFGLCNAPATFQRLMNSVLAGLQWTSCLVYLDDIIIVGNTFDQHLLNLQQVFERLKQAGLKVQPSKCQFLQQRVTFLGHVISPNGIAPDPAKTSKVKQWPVPSSRVEVQQFLGLANYYRRFVKDFATLAKPLHQLTEKRVTFKWTAECQAAFDHLKACLTSAPILAMPNWSQPFIIDTDASDTGIGAVLSQVDTQGVEHVVAYASRILTKAERNYCITRRELLAVVTFLQHFRQYLLGRSFTVRTDHGALAWLQGFKNPEGQLARWLEKLQEYTFSIVHRSGKKHLNADALSRLPCKQCGRDSHDGTTVIAMLTSSNMICGYSPQQLRSMQLADECIGHLLNAMEKEERPSCNFAKHQPVTFRRLLQQWDQLVLINGVLYRQFMQPNEGQSHLQLVVPTEIREKIVRDIHEGVAGGHLGQDKTLSRLKERFYWPGHYNDVRDWCQTCGTCASRKTLTHSPKSPLGTISASYPTQVMAVDLVGPLPESDRGNSYIMVVGDYFSRWMEAIPIPNQEASTVAEKLVDEVFLRFSAPEQLHSDQGRQFESQLVSEVCKLLHVHKTRTTPYHPQCDGLVERFNRTMLAMLATCAKDNPLDWEHYIRKVCMAYNSSIQASTGYTPFFLMFGRQARIPVDVMYGTPNCQTQTTHEYAASLRKQMDKAFALARKHSLTNHLRQKEIYDKKLHGKPYSKGDLVWLHSPASCKGAGKKLCHPWSGPYKVVKKLSDCNYRIEKLQGRKERKVVHFDRLKLCPKNIRLDVDQPSQEETAPTTSDVQQTDETVPVGHHLQLIDGDDDLDEIPVISPDQSDGSELAPATEQPSATSRYPRRQHHPPSRFEDFVRLSYVHDETSSSRRGVM